MPEIQAATAYGVTGTELTVNSDDTDETLLAATGAANKAHYLHDIYVRGGGGGTFTLKYTRGGATVTKPIDFAAGGQNGEARINIQADANTAITYTADGSVNEIDVTLYTGLVMLPTTPVGA